MTDHEITHRFDAEPWFQELCPLDQQLVHKHAAKYPDRDAAEARRYIERVQGRRGVGIVFGEQWGGLE